MAMNMGNNFEIESLEEIEWCNEDSRRIFANIFHIMKSIGYKKWISQRHNI